MNDKTNASLEDNIRNEEIDWGWCIPDCGKCCLGKGKEITQSEAEVIAKKLSVCRGDFIGLDESKGSLNNNQKESIQNDRYIKEKKSNGNKPKLRKRLLLKTINNRCIFLRNYSLCSIYNFKPIVCTKYGNWLSDCRDYRRIKTLSEKGSDISKKLKEMWLKEYSNKNYNKTKWKVKAELFVCELSASEQ